MNLSFVDAMSTHPLYYCARVKVNTQAEGWHPGKGDILNVLHGFLSGFFHCPR